MKKQKYGGVVLCCAVLCCAVICFALCFSWRYEKKKKKSDGTRNTEHGSDQDSVRGTLV